ncbi:unnamed protein product [Gongylonema pulchrum]|uniref:Uncharacterized protein n=1 Tax=Gongylonema pulchrum TaxID=637853 RepID=A0A3P6RB22_9BILA|nr:unnamed protein product [Gongylonema pulchrum]
MVMVVVLVVVDLVVNNTTMTNTKDANRNMAVNGVNQHVQHGKSKVNEQIFFTD